MRLCLCRSLPEPPSMCIGLLRAGDPRHSRQVLLCSSVILGQSLPPSGCQSSHPQGSALSHSLTRSANGVTADNHRASASDSCTVAAKWFHLPLPLSSLPLIQADACKGNSFQCPLCSACPEAFLSLSSPGDSLRYTANTISSVFCSVWCFLWTVHWAGIPCLRGWAIDLPRGAQHARFRRDLREHPALLVLHLWKRKFRAQVTWLWPHTKVITEYGFLTPSLVG
nr:uncharacterized protein LOC105487809 [Macaca nemestrina]